ncbi:MAG TPA: tetratricopeptide repeat protein, partial [Candidatus Angelobacter sp.]|nr:tetratricopeptide repeat protein [Candidatus Angelobacter sp.]
MKAIPRFFIVFLIAFWALSISAFGQTFEINQEPSNPSANTTAKKGKKTGKSPSTPSTGLGWGSSIEVGRMSRAAEDALRRGNYQAAASFAQRAVQAAPQDGRLWFLLGYTSRMAGHYQQSLEAYQRGLKSNPSSPDGLSGMAQTYAKAGNAAEAKKILLQVINAHPERVEDMLIAGELDIQTNDLQSGLNLLQRAESKKPSSHAELLMALAYMRLKQPEKAKGLLEQAKRRDPRNVEIFRAVANYFRETHDYASAITTLKNSPRKTPDVLGDLAYTYELAGEMKQAAGTYAQAADADRQNIHLQLSAAQSHVTLGDIAKAKPFLGRAEAIDANNYRLHAIRANIDRLQNRPADAIREYNFALAHIPEGVVPEGQLFPVLLRLNLSELYKDTGDQASVQREVAQAEKEISSMQVEGPQKAEFLRVRSSIKTGSNDFAGAEADLKQALALDPANT